MGKLKIIKKSEEEKEEKEEKVEGVITKDDMMYYLNIAKNIVPTNSFSKIFEHICFYDNRIKVTNGTQGLYFSEVPFDIEGCIKFDVLYKYLNLSSIKELNIKKNKNSVTINTASFNTLPVKDFLFDFKLENNPVDFIDIDETFISDLNYCLNSSTDNTVMQKNGITIKIEDKKLSMGCTNDVSIMYVHRDCDYEKDINVIIPKDYCINLLKMSEHFHMLFFIENEVIALGDKIMFIGVLPTTILLNYEEVMERFEEGFKQPFHTKNDDLINLVEKSFILSGKFNEINLNISGDSLSFNVETQYINNTEELFFSNLSDDTLKFKVNASYLKYFIKNIDEFNFYKDSRGNIITLGKSLNRKALLVEKKGV